MRRSTWGWGQNNLTGAFNKLTLLSADNSSLISNNIRPIFNSIRANFTSIVQFIRSIFVFLGYFTHNLLLFETELPDKFRIITFVSGLEKSMLFALHFLL